MDRAEHVAVRAHDDRGSVRRLEPSARFGSIIGQYDDVAIVEAPARVRRQIRGELRLQQSRVSVAYPVIQPRSVGETGLRGDLAGQPVPSRRNTGPEPGLDRGHSCGLAGPRAPSRVPRPPLPWC